MLRLRVSDLDQWVRYVEPEREAFEVSTEDFFAYMKRETEPNEAMLAGSAFHKLMERAGPGDTFVDPIIDGFAFSFSDDLPEVTAAPVSEEPCERVYETPSGPVLLRGRVDGRDGIEIVDYKLSSRFDAERYASSLQWRAYLDMTGSKRFRYLVFQGKVKPEDVWVYDVHEIIFWHYPDMSADVQRRVGELAAFVREHIPELVGDS